MERLSILAMAAILIIATELISKKYKKLQEWLDKNPEYFRHYLWLTIPTVMSVTVGIECSIRNTEQPISAIVMFWLTMFFFENIISAIDKWVPAKLEPILKLALIPVLIPVIVLQTMSVLQKRYYAPYFKESK